MHLQLCPHHKAIFPYFHSNTIQFSPQMITNSLTLDIVPFFFKQKKEKQNIKVHVQFFGMSNKMGQLHIG